MPVEQTSTCGGTDEMNSEVLPGTNHPMPQSYWISTEPPVPATLLDYFAAKAMQGCLAYSNLGPSGNWQESCSIPDLAAHCYDIAEAMIAEREKRNA